MEGDGMKLTNELLEQTWKHLREFEQEHFGLKYGEDFPAIAELLRNNKQFMNLGMITKMLGSFELSGLQREFEGKNESEKQSLVTDLMNRPGHVHGTFAELFYLGYVIGKAEGETTQLEKLGAMEHR
jgi:hypothetical protein